MRIKKKMRYVAASVLRMTTVTLTHAPRVNKGSKLHFEASQEKYITKSFCIIIVAMYL